MEDRRYRRGSFLAEGSEYPEPDPGYTPMYPWAGASTEPNQLPHTPLSVRLGLEHELGGGDEVPGELEDSSTDRHGSNSITNVVDNVYVDPDIEFVDDNSM